MVRFTQKLDRNNKIYIVKPLRQTGLFDTVEIVPNSRVAVIFQSGTSISDILSSLRIIIADLQLQEKRESTK